MKISKKIFACVLTVCMLLTMFAGVLSANAAVTGAATIGTLADPVTAGTASVNVPVTLTATEAIGGADLYIAFPENVTVSATVVTTGYSLEYLVDGEMATEGNADLTDDGVVHFVLLASDDAFAGASEVAITLTIGTAELAAGKYDITIAEGTLIGTTSEIEVDVPVENITDGGFTVAAEACKHAETKDVVTKEATCGAAGTKNVVCAACDEVISEGVEIPATGEHNWGELEYSVVDGVCYTKHACECGYEETVATVSNVPVTATAVVASSLALRFRIPMADVSAYSNIVGEFAKDTYDKDTYTGVSDIISITPTVNNSTRWQFEYAGIASYEMTAKIYINIYGTDANGYKVLVSRLEYAFVNYLADKYDSMNDKYKTLFADIAAYGTAAQRYMTYNISNPLPETFIPMDKVSELPTTFENATNVSDGIEIRPVPVVGNNIKMRYRVYKSLVADKDVNNLKITVDYIDASNKAQTFTVNGADFVTQGTGAKESWQIEFNDLVAAHLNDVLTIKLYDGDTVIGTLQYGFQTYAQNQYTSNPTSALATLCRAVVAYGKSTLAIY